MRFYHKSIYASLVNTIIGMILFNILQAMVTGNANPSFLVDERGRTIELKALKLPYHLMALVFLLAIIALTQRTLAEKTGVTRQTIVAIENAKYAPSLELAFLIAAVFNTPIQDVFSYVKDTK